MKDLLNISEDGALAPLPIREDAASGEISLTGLQKRKVGSLAEVMDVPPPAPPTARRARRR